MYYIKNGLKKQWHWLAYLFAAFGVLTVFGTGNATQVNTITTAIDSALYNYGVISEQNVSTLNLVIGIILADSSGNDPSWRNQTNRAGSGKAGSVYGVDLYYSCNRSCDLELEKYPDSIRFYF